MRDNHKPSLSFSDKINLTNEARQWRKKMDKIKDPKQKAEALKHYAQIIDALEKC